MSNYLIRRLLQSVVVLFIVAFVCFVVFQYLGDPIRANYNPQGMTAERAAVIREELKLDEPVWDQFAHWLSRALQGDFGVSYVNRLPVMDQILNRLPATVELATLALFWSTVGGILLGTWSALRTRSPLAKSSMAISLLGISTPTFVVGLMLLLTFAVIPSYLPQEFPWTLWPKLPSFGRGDTVMIGSWQTGLLTVDGWKHLILPVITLGVFQVGVMARLTRSGMLEVMSQDYVRTAWSKGLSGKRVIAKHAMRNVMIPVVTVLALSYGELIAFSIVTESIFEWPGVGTLLLDAVFVANQPMVVAYILLAALTILVLNFLVDIAYLGLNPKIRYD